MSSYFAATTSTTSICLVPRLCYHCNENNNSSFSYIANAADGNSGLCQQCKRPLQPGLRAEDEDW